MSELSLLYLHGFLSSPDSHKARQTCLYAEENNLASDVLVPELTRGPEDTLTYLFELLSAVDRTRLGIVGSSLGGFYATVLAEALQVPAVLINPAVSPWRYWQDYVGTHHNYHTGQAHEVTMAHVEQLRDAEPDAISRPDNYKVFLQRHDEVLDYRLALDRYGEQQCVVRDDGNHAYENFASELPLAFDFLLSRIGQSVR